MDARARAASGERRAAASGGVHESERAQYWRTRDRLISFLFNLCLLLVLLSLASSLFAYSRWTFTSSTQTKAPAVSNSIEKRYNFFARAEGRARARALAKLTLRSTKPFAGRWPERTLEACPFGYARTWRTRNAEPPPPRAPFFGRRRRADYSTNWTDHRAGPIQLKPCLYLGRVAPVRVRPHKRRRHTSERASERASEREISAAEVEN